MIFAAGLGTRLRPLTDAMPKALVPVGGHPLLWHVITKLQAAGFDDLVVNVHHFPSMIREYLASSFPAVQVSDESLELLETGGGIRHARPFLEGEPFLVHNVDILSNLDLGWFVSCVQPSSLATLLVSSRETRRYLLFDDSMRLVGWTDMSTGEVRTPFPGLNVEACRRYAFSGIHFMGLGVFEAFEALEMPARFPIMDFYLKACARYPIYGVVAPELRLLDVGKLDSLAAAEAFLGELGG